MCSLYKVQFVQVAWNFKAIYQNKNQLNFIG